MGSRSLRACVVMVLGGSLLTTGAIPTGQMAATAGAKVQALTMIDLLIDPAYNTYLEQLGITYPTVR